MSRVLYHCATAAVLDEKKTYTEIRLESDGGAVRVKRPILFRRNDVDGGIPSDVCRRIVDARLHRCLEYLNKIYHILKLG